MEFQIKEQKGGSARVGMQWAFWTVLVKKNNQISSAKHGLRLITGQSGYRPGGMRLVLAWMPHASLAEMY